MVDKKCVEAAITEHITIFGLDQLASLAADKGYYSHANVRKAVSKGVKEVGIQCPGRVKTDQSEQNIQDAKRLRDRRAGIEPLIGHAKKFGLGRSRMKSDTTTLASGYRSILGFNLRQLERNISESMKKAA
jgi:IS5 family transposase